MSEALVRPERPEDVGSIREVERAAFRRCPGSLHTEHLIVDGLRASGALALSLVAVEGDRIVGHVAFSPAAVGQVEQDCFLLGPLGVLPSEQHRGIGTALVEAGLDELHARRARCCLVVGDPGFYGRFGFRSLAGLCYEGISAEHVMCLPLDGPAPAGTIRAHEAFTIEARR